MLINFQGYQFIGSTHNPISRIDIFFGLKSDQNEKTIEQIQNGHQCDNTERNGLRKLKSSEILLNSQCTQIIGEGNDIIIIDNKENLSLSIYRRDFE